MKLRKLLACGVAATMLFSMSLTVFAATPSESIISALESANVPAQYITQAKNYLATTTVDEAAATKVVEQINAAKATAGGVSSFASLTADQKKAIADDITAAATTLGLTASYDASSDKLVIADKDGKVLLTASPAAVVNGSGSKTTDGVIKATGANMNASIAVVAVLAVSLAGCGVAVNRKRIAGENA